VRDLLVLSDQFPKGAKVLHVAIREGSHVAVDSGRERGCAWYAW